MLIDEFHPEDIKAAIRKRYRSMLAFERAHGLARQATSEVLRGRPSARTEHAIRRILAEDARWAKSKTITAVPSSADAPVHQQNAAA